MKKKITAIAAVCCTLLTALSAVTASADSYDNGYGDVDRYSGSDRSFSHISRPDDVTFYAGSSGMTFCTAYGLEELCITRDGSDNIHIESLDYDPFNYIITMHFTATGAGTAVFGLSDEKDPSAVEVSFTVTAKEPPEKSKGKKKKSSSAEKGKKTDSAEKEKESVKEKEISAPGEILKIVNKKRSQSGISPLSLDEDLCAAAELRAKEIGRRFSHTRPDGRSCVTVLDDNDISYRMCGENIAWSMKSPEDVMKMWMDSPPHKANILNSSFTKMGAAYDASTDSWVQIFVG